MKKKLTLRRFLNKPGHEGLGALLLTCELEEYRNPNNPTGNLQISDCSRMITLDLKGWDKATTDNTIFKLDQIIDACEKAKEFFEYHRVDE